ncbi:MAG: hypothetical protein HQL96_06690 [Magnetococcales bacterium]|nr:hypothetical protein [Magnetococcales bacterium]
MNVSARQYEAIAIDHSVEGVCGFAVLMVRAPDNPSLIYLLDPQYGLRFPLALDEYQAMSAEAEVCPFSPQWVTDQDVAFYINPPLTEAFRQMTGRQIDFSLSGIKRVEALNDRTSIAVANREELAKWRRQLAETMFEAIDASVDQLLNQRSPVDDDLWEIIEEWARCGALCAGDAMGLFSGFMVRVGAAISIRPAHSHRLRLTHATMIVPFLKDYAFNDYADDAEKMRHSWIEKSRIHKTIRQRDSFSSKTPSYTFNNTTGSSRPVHSALTNHMIIYNANHSVELNPP